MALNKQTKQILEYFKKKKYNAEKIADDNLNYVLGDAKFKNLFHKEKSLMFDIANKSVHQNFYEEKISDLNKLEQVKIEELNILKSYGLTFEDLVPNYSCKKCNDNGVFENKFCSCFKTELSKYLLKLSNIPCLENFDKTNSEYMNKDLKMLYLKMQKWCDNFPNNNKHTILFSGNTGLGKTFLTSCMASKLIENGVYVVFTTAFNLNNSLLKYHTTFNEEKDEIIRPYLECDVLIIDDLATEPILKNVTLEYLYLIINERKVNSKSIIITTNLDLNMLEDRYGSRIASRIIDKSTSFAYEFKGEDLRKMK